MLSKSYLRWFIPIASLGKREDFPDWTIGVPSDRNFQKEPSRCCEKIVHLQQ